MSTLDLSPDELLTTTRSVRKRLDFSRPVEPELIKECLELAVQAPTGGNSQGWHFVVVTDAQHREALGAIYRKGWATYVERMASGNPMRPGQSLAREQARTLMRVRDSAQYLADHMHEVPVLIVPCIWGRTDGLGVIEQAGVWGSILPAAWSFMLALRSRGLGSAWTTLHLVGKGEKLAADVLGIPFGEYRQGGLFPIAYTKGTDFRRADRLPAADFAHWNEW